jgi:hypothetical protein
MTLHSWWRGLLARDPNTKRTRYSLAKSRRFVEYAKETSTFRQLAVILLFPVPALLVALMLPLIPLQNPSLGVLANWGSASISSPSSGSPLRLA